MRGIAELASHRKQRNTCRQWRLLPLALLLTACATESPPAPSVPAQAAARSAVPLANAAEEATLRTLVLQQDRLYRVAAPLLVNNPQLCKNYARNLLGFTAKNKYSYSSEFTDTAQKLFGMDQNLKVMGVLEGSAAARAGVRRGDDLLAIEDNAMPQGQNVELEAAAILAPLVSGRSSVKLTVMRDGATMALTVPLTYACAFGIELGNTDNVAAYSDGNRVLITRGMLNTTRSDDELAYVMAKEIAHNALAHAKRQDMNAAIGGIIDTLIQIRPDMSAMTGLAGVKPVPKELDAAADKLSLYMLARAGYDINNAPSFWRRLAAQYPATVLTGYTALHPATSYRMAAMDAAIKEIRTKQAGRKPLLP